MSPPLKGCLQAVTLKQLGACIRVYTATYCSDKLKPTYKSPIKVYEKEFGMNNAA